MAALATTAEWGKVMEDEFYRPRATSSDDRMAQLQIECSMDWRTNKRLINARRSVPYALRLRRASAEAQS